MQLSIPEILPMSSPSPGLSTSHKWAQGPLPPGDLAKNESNSTHTFLYRRDNTIEKVLIRDNGGTTRFWLGAGLIESRRPPMFAVHRSALPAPARRSFVSGFSYTSRLRLMRKLATIRRDAVPIFVTLTYPASFPDPALAKKHLHNFRRSFLRRYPDASLLWKLEAQRRGAPHFHLFIYGITHIADGFRSLVAELWYNAVGSGDLRHLRAGVRVEYLRSVRGAYSYAAKYMGKSVESLEEWGRPGRFWGIYNRDKLPIGIALDVPLSWLESIDLQRYLRRYAKLPGKDRATLVVFVSSPEDWLRVLDLCGSLPTADTS